MSDDTDAAESAGRLLRPEIRERPASVSTRWWLLAAVLMIISAGCAVVGLRGGTTTPVDRTASGTISSSTSAGLEPGGPSRTGAGGSVPLARSVPTGLRVPAIGVSVSLGSLGLKPDGTVQVPVDFEEAGWFAPGPAPGQIGSAVILGHVDSYRGPAVFYRLRSLKAGDAVDVTLADGAVAHFTVDRMVTYPKAEFPARLVYASHGTSALQLVTCGGEFDRRTGSYLSNVVAYTSLVSTTPGRPGP